MNRTPTVRRNWSRVSLMSSALYLIVGVTFAWPTTHVHTWGLAAWVVSGCVFGAQILYELHWLRNLPRDTALHTSVAAAMGAFALAVAGMLHDVVTRSTIRPNWYFAMVALPVVTGVPAYLVALVAATILARLRPRRPRGPSVDQ